MWTSAAQSRPLRTRARDRDPEDGVGPGRLAAHGGWQRTTAARDSGAGAAGRAISVRPGPRGLRGRRTTHRFPVAALALARGIVQPARAPRFPAPVRPRDHRQPVPAITGGAPPAGPVLQRLDRDGVRARALPAARGPGLLLQ